MNHPIRALVFDLDGTLVDSLPDLTEAVNDLMAANGLGPHPESAVSAMVGKGVPVLVQKAFDAHGVIVAGEVLAAQVKTYLGFYEPRATRLTRLFPHVAEMMGKLSGAGYRLAVCTNKPTAVSREIAAQLALSNYLALQNLRVGQQIAAVGAANLAVATERGFPGIVPVPSPSFATN